MRRLRAKLMEVGDIGRRFGIGAAVSYAAYRATQFFLDLKTFVGLRLDPNSVSSELVCLPEGVSFRRGTLNELAATIEDSRMDVTEDFARLAVQRGDSWYVLARDGKILSYLWCSSRRTEVFPGLDVRFSENWAYYYKGFTPASYRGQRFIEMLNGLVLRDVCEKEKSGLLCLVESTNFASLRACALIGYRSCARFHVLRAGQSLWIWRSGHDVATGLTLVRSDD